MDLRNLERARGDLRFRGCKGTTGLLFTALSKRGCTHVAQGRKQAFWHYLMVTTKRSRSWTSS